MPVLGGAAATVPPPMDDVLIRLIGDFDDDGRFGRRTLEVASDHVRILDGTGAETLRLPIADVKSARNEPLVGGGRLEVTTNRGEILPLLSYSLTHAPKFS